MAIYHLAATVISRGRGQSVVAAAAYRSGSRLRDERYGATHNYVGKGGVVHAEIMVPPAAPDWASDRQQLWNRVEAAELRNDSQLARLIEVGLPVELTLEQCVALMRDFIAAEFVARGMIADFSIRHGRYAHAHVLLTLRALQPPGFGLKERRWNGKATLLEWRSAWADRVNEHLARAGHSLRVDHRTLEAQQIELTPGRNVGIGLARADDGIDREAAARLPDYVAARIAERQRIARDNGHAIAEDPTLLLRALTHQRPTFTAQELASFLRSRTDGAAQFDAAYLAVIQSKDLVALGSGDPARFTSRDMLEAAKSLRHRAAAMAARRGHGVDDGRDGSPAAPSQALGEEQRPALRYLIGDGDLKALVAAEADKYPLLAAARVAWEGAGLRVAGAARSQATVEHWRAAGIETRHLSTWEQEWLQGSTLTRQFVLLIDGAELLGLKQMERLLGVADKARAKVVLLADPARHQAMTAESPFRDVLRALGPSEFAGAAREPRS